ncbi:hypothetical protein [Paraburkholderia sp. BL21I4N1]|uniref:hypothetical protein n=1 Tax=Paraburkholderia sp. BL21I4N1 TaxID=1938801 RepID=UPI000CFD1DB7|nr:hypothetical protein [Paraburkholderia sp. BL21I4N1]PQV50723.1 hypothetical protein B0G83_10582 [Paraburkholderia sp. BL21I4N1]
MNDTSASVPFKIASARGLLDAGLIVSICTQVAAWLGLALAFALGAWLCVAVVCVSGAVAILALWLLIRVALDRRLFGALAHSTALTNEDDALAALDHALQRLGWIDETKAGRTLDARVRGVARLVRLVTLLAIVQVLVVAVAALSGAF